MSPQPQHTDELRQFINKLEGETNNNNNCVVEETKAEDQTTAMDGASGPKSSFSFSQNVNE